MQKYNFGEYFIEAVFTLYNEAQSTVLNNGFWSEWFNVSRSCRQDCPASPLLYNLMADILGAKINQNSNIKGVEINGVEDKQAQYVDDLWLLLLYSEENINNVIHELEAFRNFSGLKTNFENPRY